MHIRLIDSTRLRIGNALKVSPEQEKTELLHNKKPSRTNTQDEYELSLYVVGKTTISKAIVKQLEVWLDHNLAQ